MAIIRYFAAEDESKTDLSISESLLNMSIIKTWQKKPMHYAHKKYFGQEEATISWFRSVLAPWNPR
jgi:hypothetical protein